jgi:site-specific DNA recombinase
MIPSHTTKQRTKRYRYYTCASAQKRGWDTCPAKSVPAAEIEQLVIGRIKTVGKDPGVLQATVVEARRQDTERLAELEAERRVLERDLTRWQADERRLARPLVTADANDPVLGRVADLQERIRQAETRLFRVREQIALLRKQWLDEDDVRLVLSLFDPVWESLTPAEQARVVQLLVERVDYDGARGRVAITFHETGIRTLADEIARSNATEKRA